MIWYQCSDCFLYWPICLKSSVLFSNPINLYSNISENLLCWCYIFYFCYRHSHLAIWFWCGICSSIILHISFGAWLQNIWYKCYLMMLCLLLSWLLSHCWVVSNFWGFSIFFVPKWLYCHIAWITRASICSLMWYFGPWLICYENWPSILLLQLVITNSCLILCTKHTAILYLWVV